MAKDYWIATGRKPTALTGAAILIAFEANSLPDISQTVCDLLHISMQTLRLR